MILAVTQATGRIALPSGQTVRVYNAGTGVVYINPGDNTVTATIAAGATPGSMPIAPGRETAFVNREGWTHLAAICPTGETANIFVTAGNGE